MDDFQEFLDANFGKLEIKTKTDDEVLYEEYDIYKEISNEVSAVRRHRGMTQKQLAQKSGLTQSNISNIENGTSKPTIDTLRKIADALEKRLVIVLEDREEL